MYVHCGCVVLTLVCCVPALERGYHLFLTRTLSTFIVVLTARTGSLCVRYAGVSEHDHPAFRTPTHMNWCFWLLFMWVDFQQP